MNDEMFEVLEAMDKYGGSFVKALADCYRCADPSNAKKLEQTFSEYFSEYSKTAKKGRTSI
jgi:hypothetical protein